MKYQLSQKAVDPNRPKAASLLLAQDAREKQDILRGAHYPSGSQPAVRVTRIDKDLPLPRYETEGSVGFDLTTREAVTVRPGEIRLIPSNVIIEVPKGYALILASRSSTPRKFGLTKPHGIGVIDLDYCGPKDEIRIQVQNVREEPVRIEKGTRIAQGLFVRVDRLEFEEVDEIRKTSRGGFGSTDSDGQNSEKNSEQG